MNKDLSTQINVMFTQQQERGNCLSTASDAREPAQIAVRALQRWARRRESARPLGLRDCGGRNVASGNPQFPDVHKPHRSEPNLGFRGRLLLQPLLRTSVRHLFGLFHLHRDKRLIQLKRAGNGYAFEIIKKNGSDREHKLYWKYLAEHQELKNDPFFYPNREDIPESDGSHRNRANYADHLNTFPMFKPLSEEYLARRIQKIAEIEFSAVPIPNADKFPDIHTVQILAYHRIVKFRQLLDEIVGVDNRFWSVQRNPSWKPKDLTFEVVEPVYTSLYARRV